MKLTDFELNKAIAELVYPDDVPIQAGKGSPSTLIKVISERTRNILAGVDYCNNWNDLMPEVVKHDVEFGISGGVVEHYYNDPSSLELLNKDNPQRALAECLLLVLQANKDKNND